VISQKKNYLPKGWVRTQIGEIFEVFSGYGFPKKYQGKKKGDLAFLKVGDISRYVQSGNIYVEKADNYVSYEVSKKIKAKPFPKYTVVFAKIGEALKLNRRAILRKDAIVDNNVMGISETRGIISALFLYYFMNTIKLENLSRATTVPSIRKSDVEMLSFPLPPLNEQNRIVAKIEELFTRLDAGVEALKQVRAQLKRYRQSVLKAAVEGRLTAEWREQHLGELEPADKLLERIQDERKTILKEKYVEPDQVDSSDLHELPDGWIWTQIGDLTISMKNGIYKQKSFYDSNGIACLRMYNIEDGQIVWKDIKRMILSDEEINEYELQPGDILVNRVNSRELVGKSATIPDNLDRCVFESKNIRLRLVQEYIRSNYVTFWFRIFAQQYFNQNAQQTVGMASINQKQLANMPIPLPALTEQEKIIKEIERLFSIFDESELVLKSELKRAQSLRQSILKRAFEGKLVPQDLNDLPAPRPGKYYIYVLECSNGSYYIGQTENIEKRWCEHAGGRGADWTRKYPPIALVHWEEYHSRADAAKREKELKTGFGRKWIKREIKAGRARQAGEPASVLLERIKSDKAKLKKSKQQEMF